MARVRAERKASSSGKAGRPPGKHRERDSCRCRRRGRVRCRWPDGRVFPRCSPSRRVGGRCPGSRFQHRACLLRCSHTVLVGARGHLHVAQDQHAARAVGAAFPGSRTHEDDGDQDEQGGQDDCEFEQRHAAVPHNPGGGVVGHFLGGFGGNPTLAGFRPIATTPSRRISAMSGSNVRSGGPTLFIPVP
jgi:hypothetical protein